MGFSKAVTFVEEVPMKVISEMIIKVEIKKFLKMVDLMMRVFERNTVIQFWHCCVQKGYKIIFNSILY